MFSDWLTLAVLWPPALNSALPSAQGHTKQLNCNLKGEKDKSCWMSRGGGVIVGMLLPESKHGDNDANELLKPQTGELQSICGERAGSGQTGGMGEIFGKVADINAHFTWHGSFEPAMRHAL